MKKNERLIAELFFINQRKVFNLTDLMEYFSISKRTALRDICELETIGAPIYVDKGRYGGYRVLENSSLPPLYLNQAEWHSLFFSLQLLKDVDSTPFNQSYQELKQKLLHISPQKNSQLNQELDQFIVFSDYSFNQSSPLLSELFSFILAPQVISFYYTRYTNELRLVQPIQLIRSHGEWYVLCWDFDKDSFRQFRCDFIEEITPTDLIPLYNSHQELLEAYKIEKEASRFLTFKAKIETSHLELFTKRQYDGVQLIEEKTSHYLIGHFTPEEIPFLLNYFLSFGSGLTLLSPTDLVTSFKQYLTSIQDKY